MTAITDYVTSPGTSPPGPHLTQRLTSVEAPNEKHAPAHQNPNSGEEQRQRTLARLQQGPCTTLELRDTLDILCPPARVMELRKRGLTIITQWVHEPTSCGHLHRVARYVLVRETPLEVRP